MCEDAPIATVVFRLVQNHQLGLATWYFAEGTCWAYANEADVGKDPRAVGALELDPRHLELTPPQPDKPPAYLYRGVVHVRQQEERMPPSLLEAARSWRAAQRLVTSCR
jgi:hypothetical protein